jgi:hypothetical protein
MATIKAFASPIPMTSSSSAIAPYWGLYRAPQGFEIDSRKTGWKVSDSSMANENILVLFESPEKFENVSAMLTARVDESRKAKNPKAYVEGWMSLYNRLGFDVLAHRPFEHRGETAFVVDLIQKSDKRQVRQALFFRGTQVVVITCNDHKDHFKETLPQCNRMIESFRWTSESKILK